MGGERTTRGVWKGPPFSHQSTESFVRSYDGETGGSDTDGDASPNAIRSTNSVESSMIPNQRDFRVWSQAGIHLVSVWVWAHACIPVGFWPCSHFMVSETVQKLSNRTEKGGMSCKR